MYLLSGVASGDGLALAAAGLHAVAREALSQFNAARRQAKQHGALNEARKQV